jgi:hypothetical protein
LHGSSVLNYKTKVFKLQHVTFLTYHSTNAVNAIETVNSCIHFAVQCMWLAKKIGKEQQYVQEGNGECVPSQERRLELQTLGQEAEVVQAMQPVMAWHSIHTFKQSVQ